MNKKKFAKEWEEQFKKKEWILKNYKKSKVHLRGGEGGRVECMIWIGGISTICLLEIRCNTSCMLILL